MSKKTYNLLKTNSNTWSRKATDLYERHKTKNNKSNLLIEINDKILNEIIKYAGSIKEYTKFKERNINSDIYIKILQNNIAPDSFLASLDKFKIKPVELLFVEINQININDYIYLKEQSEKKSISITVLHNYIETPEDTKYLGQLFELGFDEKKFIMLKERKINIQYFINSLKNGFSEDDFFRFRDKNITSEDMHYYNLFRKMGHKKNDFYIAKIFGQEGYQNFLNYLKNRRKIILTSSLTGSLTLIGIGFLAAGIVMSYYEYQSFINVEAYQRYYSSSVDEERKITLINKIVTETENRDKYMINKIVFFIIGGGITSTAIVPAVLLGIFLLRNYKMLNIFSRLNIFFYNEKLCIALRFKV